MIDKYILHKDHLSALLRKLAKEQRLVAPVRNHQGDTLFTEIDRPAGVAIDLENQPQESLKPFFLPQTEVLASYVSEGDGQRHGSGFHALPPANRPTVYFGVRSCDMMAVLYTDMIFLHGPVRDPYYERRRDQAIFITLACHRPFANCFCNATRSGPFLEFGFDLQLTDIGEHYFVETGRARGDDLLRRWPQFFLPATEEHGRLQFQALLEARGRFQRLVHVDQCVKLLRAGENIDQVIAELSARCQDCGGCAFLCPTCTCFNVTDRPSGPDCGERVRSWDACTFAGFSRMAGGHNPVDMGRERIRKRFLHKFLHDVNRQGRVSCMGCGRCVNACFGGVDVIRFISMVNEAQEARQGREA